DSPPEFAAEAEKAHLMLSLLRPTRLLVEPARGNDELNALASRNMSSETWRRFSADTTGVSSSLQQCYHRNRCYQLLEEGERQRGFKYDLVVAARVDVLFLASPPLQLMHKDGLWVPDGMDWGGLMDRWAVLGRRTAKMWFGVWHEIIHRNFLQEQVLKLPAEMSVGRDPLHPLLGPELILARSFQGKRRCSKLKRVLSTAAVRCPGWSLRSKESSSELIMNGVRRHPCTQHGFRLGVEISDAHNVVARVERDGWSWNANRPWRIRILPNFFSILTDTDGKPPDAGARMQSATYCCGLPQLDDENYSSCTGYASCFSAHMATYHRVCHGGLLGVGLVPPAPKAGEAQLDMSCWHLNDAPVQEGDSPLLCLLPWSSEDRETPVTFV
ncbi:unnamed protein product, partial [Polarella glacialis]